MEIKRNNITIIIKEIQKNFYSLTRKSKAIEIITIYARKKDIDKKTILLLNNLKETKKVLSI